MLAGPDQRPLARKLGWAALAMALLAVVGVVARRPTDLLGIVANSEVVAVEIARRLVGSVGLVAAVPITTWLAARVVSARQRG